MVDNFLVFYQAIDLWARWATGEWLILRPEDGLDKSFDQWKIEKQMDPFLMSVQGFLPDDLKSYFAYDF